MGLTTLIALAVALVPGALLGFALPPGRYRWAAWAATPALTLGLTTLAMSWLPKLGLPDSASAVLVAELLLAGLAVLGSRLVARGLVQPAEDGTRPGPRARLRLPSVRPHWADLVGVTVPALVNVAFGWLILGRLNAPPGWDAMNHGFLTRRIMDSGSVLISSACTTGATDPAVSCSFYPLAANVSWAQAAELSGGRVSTVMTAWSIILGPVALAAAVYAAVRALGGRPVVAACAAAAPAVLGPMWLSVVTGRITEQTAPAVAGAVALLIALALRGAHPVRMGLLAGLATAGIVMTHTYDVLFIGVLALGMAVTLAGRPVWRRLGAGLAAMAVAALVPLLPLLGVLLGANGERESNPPPLVGRYGESWEYWVTDPQRYVLFGFPQVGGRDFQLSVPSIQVGLWIVIPCLLLSLLALVLRPLRWARPWLVAGVVFTLLGFWTSASDSPAANTLSSLWYGVRERVRSMIFPVYGLLTVAGAVVLGLAIAWLVSLLAARARRLRASPAPAAVAATLVVLTLLGLGAVPDSWRPIRKEMKSRTALGRSYPEAFRWLQQNSPPGSVVAYDRHREFMSWSYADYDVPLLFGIPPLPGLPTENYERRWDAWNWLVNSRDARPAGCEVRQLNISYVVTGKRRMPGGWDKHYESDRIAASNKIALVHQIGSIRIYRVTDAGRACPGTR
ncbi:MULTISPECIES: DUF6541 family protein [Micromonospora]|uniref:4-amino-4-deoxy-L-arabinose transferase n=1 Tax=Micromonospora solifontis TaxID=2487138 RepID=A0ABX9WIT0_9ACTN|nr:MULTISPECIES: DUF6541 family protein [Micromonospora]NES15506.1 hypothetical protein [Micromonospora sp. PPF5-17B]RNL98972.1 hypothetical protein EFE23_12260 [Micromonospora solifontis]